MARLFADLSSDADAWDLPWIRCTASEAMLLVLNVLSDSRPWNREARKAVGQALDLIGCLLAECEHRLRLKNSVDDVLQCLAHSGCTGPDSFNEPA